MPIIKNTGRRKRTRNASGKKVKAYGRDKNRNRQGRQPSTAKEKKPEKLSKRQVKLNTSSNHLKKRVKEHKKYQDSFEPVESKIRAENKTYVSNEQTSTGDTKSAQNLYSQSISENKFGGKRPDSKFLTVTVNSQTGPSTAKGGHAYANIEGDKFQFGQIKTSDTPYTFFSSYEQRQREIERYNTEAKNFNQDQKILTNKDYKKLYPGKSKRKTKKTYSSASAKGVKAYQKSSAKNTLKSIEAGTLLLGDKGLKTFKTKVQKLRDKGKRLT
jgi:hypothetical protein